MSGINVSFISNNVEKLRKKTFNTCMMKYRWHTKTYFCLLSLLMFLSIWENVHDRSMFYHVLCVVIRSIVNTTLLFRFYVFLTVQIKLPYACTILRSRARLYCHISLLVKLDELHLFCVYLSSNKYFFLLKWFKMSLVNVIFVLSRLPCQLESLCNTRMNILTNIIEEVLNIICCQMCFLFWLQFVYFILSHIKFVTLNKIVLCFDFIDWLSDIKLSVINQRKPHHHNFWSYSRRNEKLDMSLDTMTKDNQS